MGGIVRCHVFSNDLDVNLKVPADKETLVRKHRFPQILRLRPRETIVAKTLFLVSEKPEMFFRLRAEETMLARFKCRVAQRMGCDRAEFPNLSMRKCKGSIPSHLNVFV